MEIHLKLVWMCACNGSLQTHFGRHPVFQASAPSSLGHPSSAWPCRASPSHSCLWVPLASTRFGRCPAQTNYPTLLCWATPTGQHRWKSQQQLEPKKWERKRGRQEKTRQCLALTILNDSYKGLKACKIYQVPIFRARNVTIKRVGSRSCYWRRAKDNLGASVQTTWTVQTTLHPGVPHGLSQNPNKKCD